ncbi:uncharacterized protein PG998_011975 [Apiospora kogelbergensis]|uniref:uncharacterized protein n=1 Tax=Apiospora kogelbergensis TaxID=1337665 RepID=UPI00312D2C00
MDKSQPRMEIGSSQPLLKKLHFKNISTRERTIEEAHERTFQWLLDSGHPATRPKSGSRLQKSLEGLLRTLLFEILRHDPGVIPSITSDPKLAVPLSYDEDWDVETLFQMYEIAVRQQEKVKFCFFQFADIYGHDPSKSLKLEDMTRNDIHSYVSATFNSHEQFSKLRDSDQNYEILISAVVDRARGVFLWVRLVVQILLDGFTFHESVQSLQQQLLTSPKDLEDFFHQMLKSIPPAYRLRAAAILRVATDVDQPHLLVFYHFLDEIIQGSAPELNSSSTPIGAHDLSTICEKIRRQVNGRFRGILEVTTIFDKVPEDPTVHAVALEYFGTHVDFLHRTVRYFLVSSQKAKDFFHANIGSNADLSIACTRAAVSQIKFAKLSAMNLAFFDHLVCQLFFHTRHAASLSDATTTLDDILGIAEELCVAKVLLPEHDMPFCFAGLAAQSGHTSFLEHKFKMGLSLDAVTDSQGKIPGVPKPVLDSRDSLAKKQTNSPTSFVTLLRRQRRSEPQQLNYRRNPLLDYALTPNTPFAAPCITTVELLISQGASPNEKILDPELQETKPTVWEHFLASLYLQKVGANHKEYLEITELLLRNAASFSCGVKIGLFLSKDIGQPRLHTVQHLVEKKILTARELIKGYFTLDEEHQLIPSRMGRLVHKYALKGIHQHMGIVTRD